MVEFLIMVWSWSILNYNAGGMASSGMLRRVALARTDVSEDLSASIISMTRICEVGTLA
jgi:hypothetical protein